MDAVNVGAVNLRTSPTLLVQPDLLEVVRQRITERAIADPQLPPWPEQMRGVPNCILNTALFGANVRGKRRYMMRELIASLSTISLFYTGQRLYQSDQDAWQGVLHLARESKLGERVEFTEKGFLRLIDRGGPSGNSIGKSDREWLKKVLARLSATTVEIKHEVTLVH